MNFRTVYGKEIEHPFYWRRDIEKLQGKSYSTLANIANEHINKAIGLFKEIQRADHDIITLREENKRLLHENEFMLKLINNGIEKGE